MKTARITTGRVPIAPGIIVSRQQAAVLCGIVAGHSMQEIADQQQTTRTVATIAASRAYRKIGCKDRFGVKARLQELEALETICHTTRPTAEELATQLVAELKRTGRYEGHLCAVLIATSTETVSVSCLACPCVESPTR